MASQRTERKGKSWHRQIICEPQMQSTFRDALKGIRSMYFRTLFLLLVILAVSGCSNQSTTAPTATDPEVTLPSSSSSPSASDTGTDVGQVPPAIRAEDNPSPPLTPPPTKSEIEAAAAKKLAEREELDKTLWAEVVQAQA